MVSVFPAASTFAPGMIQVFPAARIFAPGMIQVFPAARIFVAGDDCGLSCRKQLGAGDHR